MSYGYQSFSNRLRALKNINDIGLNYFSSYFRSIVTQNKEIAAENGCGRAKTACSPRFFKLEIFFFQNMSRYTTGYPKNSERHVRKKFLFLASV